MLKLKIIQIKNVIFEETNKYHFMWSDKTIKQYADSYELNEAVLEKIKTFFNTDENLMKYCKVLDKANNYIRFSIFYNNYFLMFKEFKQNEGIIENIYYIKKEIAKFDEKTKTSTISDIAEASLALIFKMNKNEIQIYHGATPVSFTPEIFNITITSCIKY